MARFPNQMKSAVRNIVGLTVTDYTASPAQVATLAFGLQDADGIAKAGSPTALAACGMVRVYIQQVNGNITSGPTFATATSGATLQTVTITNSATARVAELICTMGATGLITITASHGDGGVETADYNIWIDAGSDQKYAGTLTVGPA